MRLNTPLKPLNTPLTPLKLTLQHLHRYIPAMLTAGLCLLLLGLLGFATLWFPEARP